PEKKFTPAQLIIQDGAHHAMNWIKESVGFLKMTKACRRLKMANSNAVTISVKEYDIESISRAVPGQISHLGITFSFNPPKEVNFGSFTNGKYNPVGGLFNPFDVVDGFIGQLGMPSSIAAQVSVTQEYAEALYDQVQAFANDLAKAGIGYSLIAVNSNSAAALAMAILGIDPKGTSFKGWPVGINIDLAGIKGIKTPAEYRKIAMEIYQQKVIDKMGVPVPTARPECFLAGTMIDMWPLDLKPDASGHYDEKVVLAKIWQKPIEEVTPDDWVVSYDDNGRLKPGRVTRTFQNHSKHILDVHGLM
ncbi:MAG: hypothetical protein GY754_46795, partial [bacterium]|nr:hypothetical protein [bacterium]